MFRSQEFNFFQESKIDLFQAYEINQSNGSTNVFEPILNEENTLIAIENIAMCGEVFLYGAPSRTRTHEKAQARPAALASLERSIKEHADVWAELSKY